MGALKELELQQWEDRERRWEVVAKKNGYDCEICGNTPTYDERDIYFDTGYCSHCAYEVAKDD